MNCIFEEVGIEEGKQVCELYLGDSYDLIKRFWSESLRSIAPLYAHRRIRLNSMVDHDQRLWVLFALSCMQGYNVGPNFQGDVWLWEGKEIPATSQSILLVYCQTRQC